MSSKGPQAVEVKALEAALVVEAVQAVQEEPRVVEALQAVQEEAPVVEALEAVQEEAPVTVEKVKTLLAKMLETQPPLFL